MTLIVDANVLIDYADTDLSALAIYSSRIDPIQVPRAVVDEVEQMEPPDFAHHEMEVVEEPLDIAMAASERRGGLSYPDRVCLLLAQRTGAICVTNENPFWHAAPKQVLKAKGGYA
jgi:predicted nucleic acid-binding protein